VLIEPSDRSIIQMTARAFAANPDLFSETLLLIFLNKLIDLLSSSKQQDIENALSALFIILKQKKILKFIEKLPNLLNLWLKQAKTTNGEIRVAFLVSLESLLDRNSILAEENSMLIYKIISHLFNPTEIFATTSNLQDFVKFLFKFLTAPFTNEELATLHVIQSIF